jgi:sulfite reductase (NADPH) hemoprotein beta-component
MNACGHHHIGHIGILGVDKKGEEWYQIQLGGSANSNAALGKVLGPSLSRQAVTDGIEKLLDVYVENRLEQESFLSTYQRIGIEKFKQRVYGTAS